MVLIKIKNIYICCLSTKITTIQMKSPLLKIAFLLVCIPLWSQTAAPTPSKAPADVISVFSDAYTKSMPPT